MLYYKVVKVYKQINIIIYLFICLYVFGAHGPEAKLFFRELARRIASVNNEPLSHQFLVQRLAVAIQRGNASAVLGSLRVWDKHEWSDW